MVVQTPLKRLIVVRIHDPKLNSETLCAGSGAESLKLLGVGSIPTLGTKKWDWGQTAETLGCQPINSGFDSRQSRQGVRSSTVS